jgi:hypothetical protein
MELKQAGGEQLSGEIALPTRPSKVEAVPTAGGDASAQKEAVPTAGGDASAQKDLSEERPEVEGEAPTKKRKAGGVDASVLVSIKQHHHYTPEQLQPHDLNILLNQAQEEARDEHNKPLFHRYGRDFFDVKEQHISKCRDLIKVFFGYTVAADKKYIGGDLSFVVKVDSISKVIAKRTALQEIEDKVGRQDWSNPSPDVQRQVRNIFHGRTVVTTYNNMPYRVADVVFENSEPNPKDRRGTNPKNLRSTFPTRKDGAKQEITFEDYLAEKHGIHGRGWPPPFALCVDRLYYEGAKLSGARGGLRSEDKSTHLPHHSLRTDCLGVPRNVPGHRRHAERGEGSAATALLAPARGTLRRDQRLRPSALQVRVVRGRPCVRACDWRC